MTETATHIITVPHPCALDIGIQGDLVRASISGIEHLLRCRWTEFSEDLRRGLALAAQSRRRALYKAWDELLGLEDDNPDVTEYFKIRRMIIKYATIWMWGDCGSLNFHIYKLVIKRVDTEENKALIQDLVNDDWLEDLVAEYGKQKAGSIRIPRHQPPTPVESE